MDPMAGEPSEEGVAVTDNPLEAAVKELASFLEGERIPYMVIGAVAGLVWGLRRGTFDVDVTVWAGEREQDIVGLLCARFPSRVPEPAPFVSETGVLPVTVHGTDADVVFGRLPYEEGAIRRARPIPLGDGTVRVCSPEDLIVHKIISERPRDWEDVQELAKAMSGKLDRAYLDPIVEGLARELSRPEVGERYFSLFA